MSEQINKQSSEREAFQKQADEKSSGPEMPKIDFTTFIVSLSTSVLVHIGEMKDPSGKTQKNLPFAKQTIDVLGMLQEKTEGNLTVEEKSLLQHILTDMRMRYLKEVK